VKTTTTMMMNTTQLNRLYVHHRNSFPYYQLLLDYDSILKELREPKTDVEMKVRAPLQKKSLKAISEVDMPSLSTTFLPHCFSLPSLYCLFKTLDIIHSYQRVEMFRYRFALSWFFGSFLLFMVLLVFVLLFAFSFSSNNQRDTFQLTQSLKGIFFFLPLFLCSLLLFCFSSASFVDQPFGTNGLTFATIRSGDDIYDWMK
jgi:hypothetical protein